jgi:hypothetical protein
MRMKCQLHQSQSCLVLCSTCLAKNRCWSLRSRLKIRSQCRIRFAPRYPQSTWSNEPGSMAGRPKLGLGWQESAHRWNGTTYRAVSLGCSEWSWKKNVGMGAVEPAGRRRLAADRAERDHNSRCTVESWSRICANRQP